MIIRNLFIFCISISLLISCGPSNNKRAKRISQTKMQIVTLRAAYDSTLFQIKLDSLNFKAIQAGNKLQKLIIINGILPIDTIDLKDKMLEATIVNDIEKADLDFDGNCEFIIPDKKTSKLGGMKHYYFIYDAVTKNYIENTSLPSIIHSFKLDIKNQRLKLYCPNEECFAYYKYNKEKKFELVQGEFRSVD
jgi:hypothetical protein